MNQIDLIKQKTEELIKYCDAYYNFDAPLISDYEYDKLFDELKNLEDKENFWMANSPTRRVQGKVLDGFTKVAHSKPMLSASKTKDAGEIEKFARQATTYCSWKLDGLTLVVVYENGELVQAITRGSGVVGEDVTEQAKMIKNLPMKINYSDRLELRGECVIDWKTFNQINDTLPEPYSHPRNLAAGSLRSLDSNITRQRGLSYIVFESVTDLAEDKLAELEMLDSFGFETVETYISYKDGELQVDECISEMDSSKCKYPVDGLIFEYSNKPYSKSLPATSHHEGCRMALKWADDIYETTLRDVVWQTSRTGLINPVAVFDEIDLNGALTTRATLHNVSIIEELKLGIGDIITVYRSNMVIPKIDGNLTKSNTLEIPNTCPCCGHEAVIKNENGSKTLHCSNNDCTAKLVGRFAHFVSRKAMNIENLSEATLELLISNNIIHNFKDIYHLDEHYNEITRLQGMGEKSAKKLINSIEKSRNVKLENFICAVGIPNIGLSASKTISEYFHGDHLLFVNALATGFDFSQLEDFGEITNKSLHDWWASKDPMAELLPMEMNFIVEEKKVVNENPFIGKSICVTGKLAHFTRDSINTKITSLGAKVSSGVSAKTDFLITNTPDSGSSKNANAKKFGTKIITEAMFIEMIGE